MRRRTCSHQQPGCRECENRAATRSCPRSNSRCNEAGLNPRAPTGANGAHAVYWRHTQSVRAVRGSHVAVRRIACIRTGASPVEEQHLASNHAVRPDRCSAARPIARVVEDPPDQLALLSAAVRRCVAVGVAVVGLPTERRPLKLAAQCGRDQRSSVSHATS